MPKTKDPIDLFTRIKDVNLSPDGLYRYTWTAEWEDRNPRTLVMVALNPSTADALSGDPTVNRMVFRGQSMGFGRFTMLNAAAFRSTDPKGIYRNPIAIGPDNDAWIERVVRAAVVDDGMIVYGWGTNLANALPGRDRDVDRIVRAAGGVPHALKVTKSGHPTHPLYIAYSFLPQPYALPEIKP